MTAFRARYRPYADYVPPDLIAEGDPHPGAGASGTPAFGTSASGTPASSAGARIAPPAAGQQRARRSEGAGVDSLALASFQSRISRAGREATRRARGAGNRLLPVDHDLRALPVLPVRRRRNPLAAVGASLLVLLGLTVMGLTALGDRLTGNPFYRLLSRFRLAAAGLAAGCVFLLSGVSVYAVVLPQVGVHAPGQNALHKLLNRVPGPWRPNRPEHVSLPEGMAGMAPRAAVPSPAVNYPPSATSAGDGIGAGRSVSVATIGDVPPATPVTAPAPSLPALPAVPPTAKIDKVSHQWQTWNNCGPATITMAASVFGKAQDQTAAMNFMKTTPADKNVRPDEMVSYARSLGLGADWRVGGDLTRLKHFIANGIPVVVEVSYLPEPGDWMGHYRLLTGYDDAAGRFIAQDSVISPGIDLSQPYGKFDEEWQIFNRTYIPVYKPEQADLVQRILGRDREDRLMFEHALATAEAETTARPDSGFGWFNVGTNLVALGRTADAVAAYDRARSLKLPWRMLWYQFGPFEAYLAEGRLGDVLALADANLAQSKDLEESHYFRGRVLQARGQTEAARTAYQAALRANGRFAPASEALKTLG